MVRKWVTCSTSITPQMGESDAIETGGLVDGGYKLVLVLMDDMSRFVRLEGAVSCTMEVSTRSVLK